VKIFVIGGVTVPDTDPDYARQSDLVRRSMQRLGADIVESGHDLLVCSPFSPTADVAALRGAANAIKAGRGNSVIDFHYPDQAEVRTELDGLVRELSIQPHRYAYRVTLDAAGNIQGPYGWLLPQISAMDRSHVAIGLGGRPGGSASLLFGIAQSRRHLVLPLTFLGGAAASAFQARQYELEDRLKDKIAVLHEPAQIGSAIGVLETLARAPLVESIQRGESRFFISYARTRPQEADFIEMTLRRRNYNVFRDERDFGAGKPVQNEIIEHIHRSNVFIVVWCKEYACSPWCYDEFEIALERYKANSLSLWILQVDETRIVPPLARSLIAYPVTSREQLEGQILKLLDQANPTAMSE
jgi:hypothetical protein